MRAATVRASAAHDLGPGPGSRWATAGMPASAPWRTLMSSGMAPRNSSSCSRQNALAAAAPEDLGRLAAVRADEGAHVLDDAHDRHGHPPEHGERLVHVQQRHVLGRGDQHRAADGHRLGERQLRVGGAGRQVDDEVVQLAPVHVPQELLDGAADERAAPHDGLALGHEELDADDLDAVALEGPDLAVRRWPRARPRGPSSGGCWGP